MSWIDVRNFSYTYPGSSEPVLKDITLSIDHGGFAVITGESGCGKSTLGKALAGFLFQDEFPNHSGSIIVNGTDMTRAPLFLTSERVAYVQQNPEDQFCTLSVVDEIAFGLENQRISPKEIDQRIDKALSIVNGFSLKNRHLSTLSGGEKQKVAIASMLALSPNVLILDEPTSNLDPHSTLNIFDTLFHMREVTDLTVVIIEHKLDQLKKFNPQVFMLDAGKIQPIQDIPSFQTHLSSKDYQFPKMETIKENNEESLIEFSQVYINLGEHRILHDISFSLSPGEFVGVMGDNGSGKSTLLRTIMGFHKPDTGSITGFGRELSNLKMYELVKHIGFIFQNPDHQLFTQSIWDETTLTLKNLGVEPGECESIANPWLDSMGFFARKEIHPQRLSYGEKRRLNLIAILLHKPKLLLIDEFLIGQDMANAHAWMKFFRDYTQLGNTVLLINHHPELTQQYCSRIIFLEGGRIILDQPIENAFKPLSNSGYDAYLPHAQRESAYA